MLSYKMLLNILILLLCTSCLCATSDDCSDDIDAFYFSVKEKSTGEDAVIKYDIKEENIFLTDDKGNNIKGYVYIIKDSVNSFITVSIQGYYRNGNNQFLNIKFKSLNVGDFNITLKDIEKTRCCIAKEIKEFESISDSVIVTKKSEEEKQPFYEVQF
jgi:hypothetical protein